MLPSTVDLPSVATVVFAAAALRPTSSGRAPAVDSEVTLGLLDSFGAGTSTSVEVFLDLTVRSGGGYLAATYLSNAWLRVAEGAAACTAVRKSTKVAVFASGSRFLISSQFSISLLSVAG